jgi:hypothetical protein
MPDAPTFEAIQTKVRSELRKQARKGKLVDTAFKEVIKNMFPNATSEEVYNYRRMFFMGAGELLALQMNATDAGDFMEVSEDELNFFDNVMTEVYTKHSTMITQLRELQALRAGKSGAN